MEQLDVAGRFVDRFFPAATVAILAGSSARGARTPTSDIDLLLLGPAEMFDDGGTSLAATYEFEGEIVEVFAYTAEGFEGWADRGVAQFRPVIVDMLLEGLPLRAGPLLDELRPRWRGVLERGPVPDPHELRLRRYGVTDLLDDLADAADPLEQQVLAALLFQRTAELLLLSNGRWIGSGKYLPRRLREWDAVRADRLAAPWLGRDLTTFASVVRSELDAVGGRVQAGFVR